MSFKGSEYLKRSNKNAQRRIPFKYSDPLKFTPHVRHHGFRDSWLKYESWKGYRSGISPLGAKRITTSSIAPIKMYRV